MALKFKYPSQAEVPEQHASLYVERDGAFVLDAEGAVEKSKVDEFRTTNLALKNQLAAPALERAPGLLLQRPGPAWPA